MPVSDLFRKMIVSTCIVVSLLCNSALAAVTDEFLITRNSIGRIRLGQTKSQVFENLKEMSVKEVDLLLEGSPSPALQVFRGNQVLITAELDRKGKVYRISTRSPQYRTTEGIRVGSTFGTAKSYFGTPLAIEQGEDGIYAISSLPSGTISFRLNLAASQMGKLPPDATKIVEILVVD